MAKGLQEKFRSARKHRSEFPIETAFRSYLLSFACFLALHRRWFRDLSRLCTQRPCGWASQNPVAFAKSVFAFISTEVSENQAQETALTFNGMEVNEQRNRVKSG
jgi:hypothetical protein